jgi:hypothetical protein
MISIYYKIITARARVASWHAIKLQAASSSTRSSHSINESRERERAREKKILLIAKLWFSSETLRLFFLKEEEATAGDRDEHSSSTVHTVL